MLLGTIIVCRAALNPNAGATAPNWLAVPQGSHAAGTLRYLAAGLVTDASALSGGSSCLTLRAMIPAPDTDFLLRIDTNEMIERERFTALLSSIEEALRRHRAGGPRAYLLVGAVRHGSVEIVLAVGGIAATVIMALPSFLVDLKQLAGDRKAEPNGFAVALADVMAFDGASRADFVYKDKTVTIQKSEVPFVQKIAFGHAIRNDRQQAIRPEV